jgi:hypothetical protein
MLEGGLGAELQALLSRQLLPQPEYLRLLPPPAAACERAGRHCPPPPWAFAQGMPSLVLPGPGRTQAAVLGALTSRPPTPQRC